MTVSRMLGMFRVTIITIGGDSSTSGFLIVAFFFVCFVLSSATKSRLLLVTDVKKIDPPNAVSITLNNNNTHMHNKS